MANTYVKLNTATVGSGGAASITFSDIPNGYIDLIVKASVRSTDSSARSLYIAPNGLTSNLFSIRLEGYGTSGQGGGNTSNGFVGYVGGSSYQANTFSLLELHFTNYLNANKEKRVTVNNGSPNTNTTDWYIASISQGWRDRSPINSITFTVSAGNIAQYSTFTLYGVFNADVSTAPATPTIGTASTVSGDGSVASITFTGVSNAASYTMTSTPGSITETGTTSPIVVRGLTEDTSYTFKVKANNPFGSSAESAASNSVTVGLTPAFESIATMTLTGTATSIDFTSIPSTYKHLQLRWVSRGTYSSTNGQVYGYFNNDRSGIYSWHYLEANGSSLFSDVGATSGSEFYWRNTAQATAGANIFASGVMDIVDYKETTKFKTFRSLVGLEISSLGLVNSGSGQWRSTNAINRITFQPQDGSWAAGSKFALYGIKG